MKNFFVTLGIISALLLASALIAAGIIAATNGPTATELACDDAWDRMESFNRCVAQAGCFYDAETWYQGKKAHSFHDKHCTAPEVKLQKPSEETLETLMDTRYASTRGSVNQSHRSTWELH